MTILSCIDIDIPCHWFKLYPWRLGASPGDSNLIPLEALLLPPFLILNFSSLSSPPYSAISLDCPAGSRIRRAHGQWPLLTHKSIQDPFRSRICRSESLEFLDDTMTSRPRS